MHNRFWKGGINQLTLIQSTYFIIGTQSGKLSEESNKKGRAKKKRHMVEFVKMTKANVVIFVTTNNKNLLL